MAIPFFMASDTRPCVKAWRLQIFCVGARGLRGSSALTSLAPFVELQLEGVVAATAVKHGASPVWNNEAMTLQALLGSRSLSISVLNYRSSGHHDVLGCCWLPLASLPLRDLVERELPLRRPTSRALGHAAAGGDSSPDAVVTIRCALSNASMPHLQVHRVVGVGLRGRRGKKGRR